MGWTRGLNGIENSKTVIDLGELCEDTCGCSRGWENITE